MLGRHNIWPNNTLSNDKHQNVITLDASQHADAHNNDSQHTDDQSNDKH
jgi:hypothetical protein